MTISILKYLETASKPSCCGLPMVRRTNYLLLREPPTPVRLTGYVCQACQRLGVSPEDIKGNAHRALKAARRVRIQDDVFKLIKSDSKGRKKDG